MKVISRKDAEKAFAQSRIWAPQAHPNDPENGDWYVLYTDNRSFADRLTPFFHTRVEAEMALHAIEVDKYPRYRLFVQRRLTKEELEAVCGTVKGSMQVNAQEADLLRAFRTVNASHKAQISNALQNLAMRKSQADLHLRVEYKQVAEAI